MKLYIAGPMRGFPDFNFPAFFQAETDLKAVGYSVINPARRDIEHGFDYEGKTGNEDLVSLGLDLRAALAWDTQRIALEAQGIALLPGWEASKGTAAEVSLAKALNLPVHLAASWVALYTPKVHA